jgi:hypothetical protein
MVGMVHRPRKPKLLGLPELPELADNKRSGWQFRQEWLDYGQSWEAGVGVIERRRRYVCKYLRF